jgi:pimeloyl-ACP methyl ester carboxylesterase
MGIQRTLSILLALALLGPTSAGVAHAKKDKGGEGGSGSGASASKGGGKSSELGPSEMIPPPTPLSKVMIVDQQRIHMLEAGWDHDEVLIVLPGFPEPAVAAQKMLDPLAARYHVMLLDPQGFGYSGAPNWVSYSPQGMADYVLRLMDFLELDQVHLAGFDLGGPAAIHFAYDHPERLHSLIVGAGPVYPERYSGLLADAQVPISGEQVFSRLGAKLKTYLREGLYDEARYDDQLAEDLYAFVSDRDTKNCLRQWIFTTGTDLYQLVELYERIELPVFLLWGKEDPYFPLALGDELVRTFPAARMKVIDDAGHFLMIEQPQAVAAALVDHVYQPPPPAPPFSGLSFTAYRGQSCHRFFTIKNNLEKPVKVTCVHEAPWLDAAGTELVSTNVSLTPPEEFVIAPGESAELGVDVATADRTLAIETIYRGEVLCRATERRTEIELQPVPIRLQIPNLGEEFPEGFGEKPIGEAYELDVGEPPIDELITIE